MKLKNVNMFMNNLLMLRCKRATSSNYECTEWASTFNHTYKVKNNTMSVRRNDNGRTETVSAKRINQNKARGTERIFSLSSCINFSANVLFVDVAS